MSASSKTDQGVWPSDPLLFIDSDGNETSLSISDGDLIATAITGPNAGKSVNLTFGKWA